MSDYDIREFCEADLPSLLDTFNVVYGIENPASVPRTRDQWNWIYRDNPGGWRIWVGMHDGEVVSQYAARAHRAVVDGRPRFFGEILDSMVHPEHRAGLKRPGLFVNTALPFFDAYGGVEPPRDVVHYGWPIEQALRIGKRFLEYNALRSQTMLVRPVEGELRGAGSRVTQVESFDERADALFAHAAAGFGAAIVRDAAFLNWRFRDNPFQRYTLFTVGGEDGELRGYAVYRFGDWRQPEVAVLVDFLAAEDDVDAGESLARSVLARAKADGAAALALFLPDWSVWFERFQRWGWEVLPTDYYMIGRSFDPRHRWEWFRSNWWYTLADSDLA